MSRWWLVLALVAAPLAQALQLQRTRPELCGISRHVVVAEVTDVEPVWTSTGAIERRVHVAVSEVVRGPRVDGLDLVLPGGTIGELTIWVEDAPNLLANGEYLLFLGPDPEGRLVVYGGDQGAVRILPEGARIGETRARALASVAVCRG